MGSSTDEALAPNPWTTARVGEMERIGDRLVRLRLEVATPFDHLPGQHCVLRLRAEDGYTAQRSYSIASDPVDPLLELASTLARPADEQSPEVSPFIYAMY